MTLELSLEYRRGHLRLTCRPTHWELGRVKIARARAYAVGPFLLEWYARP